MPVQTLELRFSAEITRPRFFEKLRRRLNAKYAFEEEVPLYTVDMEQSDVIDEVTGETHTENIVVIRAVSTHSREYNKVLLRRLHTTAKEIRFEEHEGSLH